MIALALSPRQWFAVIIAGAALIFVLVAIFDRDDKDEP